MSAHLAPREKSQRRRAEQRAPVDAARPPDTVFDAVCCGQIALLGGTAAPMPPSAWSAERGGGRPLGLQFAPNVFEVQYSPTHMTKVLLVPSGKHTAQNGTETCTDCAPGE